MNDQIQNTIAKIFAIEDTGIQVKLKDENKKSLGSFFKNKKDGNPTVAYQQFQDVGLKSGDTIQIAFKEVPYKDGMVKNIIAFRETNELPAPQVKTPQSTPKQTYEALNDFKPRNFDREAYEKCCSIWWAAILGSSKVEVKLIDALPMFWEYFNNIRKDGEKRFSHGMERARAALQPSQLPPSEDELQGEEAPLPELNF